MDKSINTEINTDKDDTRQPENTQSFEEAAAEKVQYPAIGITAEEIMRKIVKIQQIR